MGRWFLATAFILSMLGLHSEADAEATDVDLEIGLHGGYRIDEFDWNIAGNTRGTNPNILSELTWKDLVVHQVGAGVSIKAGRPDRAFFSHGRARLDFGWITDGENRDSDYSGDRRTLEWSRSINDAGDGEIIDLSIGGGPGLKMLSGRLTVAPLAGFSYHRQNLTLQDGYQTISDQESAPAGVTPQPIGPIEALDSSYQAEWLGPWVGVDLSWGPLERLTLSGAFEYHWADYEADARWNLRTDLAQPVSFSHEADGTGTVFAVELNYDLSSDWVIGFDARYQNWQTEPGNDQTFLADGTTATTRLNEVNWESASWIIEVNYRFF